MSMGLPTFHRCPLCHIEWRCEAEVHGRECDLPAVVMCVDCRGLG